MSGASDHLLRTLASIPVGKRILELGCSTGRNTLPLVQLGFDTYVCDVIQSHLDHAMKQVLEVVQPGSIGRRFLRTDLKELPYPDDEFSWIVAFRVSDSCTEISDFENLMQEACRVLEMGGWIYVSVPEATKPLNNGTLAFSIEGLATLMESAGFVTAGRSVQLMDGETPVLSRIFRKVDDDTPV